MVKAFKLVIAGDGGVGKTTLTKKFMTGKFAENTHITIGVSFYIKDPDDEYETYEFAWRDGNVEFGADVDPDSCPEICDDTEVFCDQCSWHGETKEL